MVRQVAKTIAKYGMLRSGDRVGVAVSGGPDSVALLHALHELAPSQGITLGVVHLNHQLRGEESEKDERFVKELAASQRLDFCCRSADVTSLAHVHSDNLEQTARNVRYDFFGHLIAQGRFDKLAVGHTRSDQAETVLFRLLRGSGSAGLAGIRPVLDGGIVRPLIELTREDVMAYLGARGCEWREDSSNRDQRRMRNRIRHQLIPQLTKQWNPKLTDTLAQLAERAQAEEQYWSGRLRELGAQHLEPTSDGVLLRTGAVARLQLAEVRRLLRVAVEKVRGDLRGIDYEHIEALREVLCSPKGTGAVHLPGLRVQRSFGEVRLSSSRGRPAPSQEFNLPVEAPGFFDGPWGPSLVALRLYHRENLPGSRGYNRDCRGLLDWEKVPKPLRLRNWRPGDCYHPHGRTGATKLKSLFQQEKIAVWERGGWPVMIGASDGAAKGVPSVSEGDERIVWVREFGPAAEFAPDDNSRVLLEIAEVTHQDSDFSVSDL